MGGEAGEDEEGEADSMLRSVPEPKSSQTLRLNQLSPYGWF